MARQRPKHVLRKPLRRRLVRAGLAAAAVTALATPAVGVVWPDEAPVAATPMRTAPAVEIRTSPVPMRVAPISRSEPRVRLEERPPEVVGHKFATAPLNVRAEPSAKSPLLRVLDRAEKIGVTGETEGVWAEIVIGEKSRWVHKEYLADNKPEPEPETDEDGSTDPAAEATPEPEPSPTPTPEPEPTPTENPGQGSPGPPPP